MRFSVVVLVALLWSGCVTRNAAKPTAKRGEGGMAATTTTPSPGSEDSKPTVTLDETLLGRVVRMDPTLRFVVMDFPVLKVPAVDQRLNVYRNGQKVGEIKVTGPRQETVIAGDITSGEAQVGDEVRAD
ncbi:MAG TPA: hypothetical protein VN887_12960 [Candidatus Angelobacter sp.]|nr:hypothetical protein [Candidatus Angelobacter sp.]